MHCLERRGKRNVADVCLEVPKRRRVLDLLCLLGCLLSFDSAVDVLEILQQPPEMYQILQIDANRQNNSIPGNSLCPFWDG